MKKTPWFKNCSPVHPGIYQRRFGGLVRWAFWDDLWYVSSEKFEMCKFPQMQGISSRQENFEEWRGLAEKPK